MYSITKSSILRFCIERASASRETHNIPFHSSFHFSRRETMGIPSDLRDNWVKRRQSSFIVASPAEDRISQSRQCTQEGVRAGFKAAAITCVATTIPTLAAVRVIPWAKANLNYTAQALIISSASIAAYFITADKTILECARRNSQNNLHDKSA